MNNKAGFALIAIALALAPAHSAPSPTPLTPTSKWNVEYADNMCILSRSYRAQSGMFVLAFKPAPMADSIQLIVLHEHGSGRSAGRAEVGFGPASPPVEGSYFSAPLAGKPLHVTAIDVKRAITKSLEQYGVLTIKAGRIEDLAFAVDRAGLAFKSLDTCVADLLKGWGMDEAAIASITTYPTPLMEPFHGITDADYPDEAIRNNEEGATGVRFVVGVDGLLRDCTIVESSGSALLDRTTCKLIMKRARFAPARDRNGTSVSSVTFTRVRWRLPQ